jgi:hypothetical protein
MQNRMGSKYLDDRERVSGWSFPLYPTKNATFVFHSNFIDWRSFRSRLAYELHQLTLEKGFLAAAIKFQAVQYENSLDYLGRLETNHWLSNEYFLYLASEITITMEAVGLRCTEFVVQEYIESLGVNEELCHER